MIDPGKRPPTWTVTGASAQVAHIDAPLTRIGVLLTHIDTSVTHIDASLTYIAVAMTLKICESVELRS